MASWHAASPRSRTASLLVAALALAGSSAARAQQGPVSADPEMVTPNFGRGMVPGVPVPDVDVRNTVRWGVVLQYQRNPVTGYRLDEEVATIVANRIAAQLGVSWDFAKWGTGWVLVPAAVNWGSEIREFDASGVGLGDIGLGLQLLPYQSRFFNFGVHGSLFVPTGQPQAYIGEPSIRGGGGIDLLGKVAFKDLVGFEVAGNAAVTARRVLDTQHDFVSGPELVLSQAARLRLAWLPVDLAFTQALIGRGQFTNFFNGGAENALEVYGGLQVPLRDIAFNTDVIIDVMAGRGTNQGYGTTDFRMLAGLTFSRNPGRKPRVTKVVVEPPPAIVPPVVEEEAPPPEDVRVFRTDTKIEIRDPIQFFVDTSNIKPESLPTLQAVADIINADARIKHIVVEGHASAEGDFTYNYELSKSRAEAIYKQLVLDGVPPDRLSYRAFGEVRPKVEGDGEDAWAVNRRVEFHIVAQFGTDTLEWPDYGKTTKLPWTGEDWKVVTPPSPDEIEEQKLREMYEKQQRDEFREPAEDDLKFGGETQDASEPTSAEPGPSRAESSAAPVEPLAAPEREDAFEGESFDTEGEEDLELEGGQ